MTVGGIRVFYVQVSAVTTSYELRGSGRVGRVELW